MPIHKAPNTDLTVYPAADLIGTPEAHKQITLGDLHGNPIKLIYFLIREGVLQLNPTSSASAAGAGAAASETRESLYKELLGIYAIADKPETLTPQLSRFAAILDAMSLQPIGCVRLIGDVLCDRGKNDFLTLMLVAKLKAKGLPLVINLSNHDAVFLRLYSADSPTEPFGNDKALPYIMFMTGMSDGCTISLHGAQNLIKHDPSLIEGARKFTSSYLESLELIGYSLHPDGKTITIYTHAPVDFARLQAVAEQLGLSFNHSSAVDIANSIIAINAAFSATNGAKKKSLIELATPSAGLTRSYANNHLYQLCWNDDCNVIPKDGSNTYFTLDNRDRVSFVHGHVGAKESPGFNLDSLLGRPASGGLSLFRTDGADYIVFTDHALAPGCLDATSPATPSLAASGSAMVTPATPSSSPVTGSAIKPPANQGPSPSRNWWANNKIATTSLVMGGVVAAGMIAVGIAAAAGVLSLPFTFSAIGSLSGVVVTGIVIAAFGLLVNSTIAGVAAFAYQRGSQARSRMISTSAHPTPSPLSIAKVAKPSVVATPATAVQAGNSAPSEGTNHAPGYDS